jgi:hypothetical protein
MKKNRTFQMFGDVASFAGGQTVSLESKDKLHFVSLRFRMVCEKITDICPLSWTRTFVSKDKSAVRSRKCLYV